MIRWIELTKCFGSILTTLSRMEGRVGVIAQVKTIQKGAVHSGYPVMEVTQISIIHNSTHTHS